jgi:hypothetical protein
VTEEGRQQSPSTEGDSAMPAKPKQIKITVHVNKPNISCTPNGGGAYLRKRQLDQICWVSEDTTDPAKRFTLAFTNFVTGAPLPWPFAEGQSGWPTSDTGWLTPSVTPPTYIKYIVQVSGCSDLDPIIIVDN